MNHKKELLRGLCGLWVSPSFQDFFRGKMSSAEYLEMSKKLGLGTYLLSQRLHVPI